MMFVARQGIVNEFVAGVKRFLLLSFYELFDQ